MKIGSRITFFLAAFCCIASHVLSSSAKFYYMYDVHSAMRIEDVPGFKWIPIEEGKQLEMGYNTDATVWCKIVYSLGRNSENVYWVFDNIHLDSISVFRNLKRWKILGDRTNTISPFLSAQAIELNGLSDNGEIELIAAVKKQNTTLEFAMHVEGADALYAQSNRNLSITFSFLGIAFLLLILTGFIYYRTRKVWHLYYILYSAMGVVYVLVNLGVLRYLFFPEFLYFSELRIYASCYWYLLMGVFLALTLNFKTHSPKLYRIFISNQWIVFGFSLLCVIGILLKWQVILTIALPLAFLLFFINILILGVAVARAINRKERLARYVLISFLPHILWGLNMILNLAGIANVFSRVDWINWIVIYEMILFGWVLVNDYIDAFRKNELLQAKFIADEKIAKQAIENARIKERRMISDLLHDKIGIDIAHTMHKLELGDVQKAKSHLFELGENIRNLSHSILPAELEEGALAAAISSQAEILNAELDGIIVDFATYDFPKSIQRELAIQLYLMVMELVQNAVKHANAGNIRIEAFGYENELVLSVSDDGIGFDSTKGDGFGLTNIRRRILDLEGEFSITTAPGKGVTALLVLKGRNTH